MKVNFKSILKSLEGNPIKKEGGGELLLIDVATNSLLALFNDEQGLAGEEKARRWLLSTRIYANPEGIDLTVEEVALVKKLIGKFYGPLIVGQAWELLENKPILS